MLRKPSEQFTLTTMALLTVALLLACGMTKTPVPSSAAPTAPASLSREERIEIFDEVWKTINEQYYDPSFHGVDWQEVYKRYRPGVEAAANDVQFYRLFEIMLAELHDAHTVFAHPHSNDEQYGSPTGTVGIALGEVEGKTAITWVEPDSDAERAGVRPGMILRTVNGKSVEQLYAEIRAQFPGSSSEQSMKQIMRSALLYGEFLGASRTFGVEGFDGAVFDVPITHRAARPTSPVLVARSLPSGFGYIRFNEWKPPADEQFKTELAMLSDAPGLIIDLRGNGGGQTDVLLNIGSLFFTQESSFGGFKKRGGSLEEIFTHRLGRTYGEKVVILVDEGSASSSEVFAASMQEHARARIVGRQTCGCVLNQWSEPLKGGGVLRWSARAYSSPKGRVLEGTGVTPDKTVAPTISDLRQGRDAALEAGETALRAHEN